MSNKTTTPATHNLAAPAGTKALGSGAAPERRVSTVAPTPPSVASATVESVGNMEDPLQLGAVIAHCNKVITDTGDIDVMKATVAIVRAAEARLAGLKKKSGKGAQESREEGFRDRNVPFLSQKLTFTDGQGNEVKDFQLMAYAGEKRVPNADGKHDATSQKMVDAEGNAVLTGTLNFQFGGFPTTVYPKQLRALLAAGPALMAFLESPEGKRIEDAAAAGLIAKAASKKK